MPKPLSAVDVIACDLLAMQQDFNVRTLLLAFCTWARSVEDRLRQVAAHLIQRVALRMHLQMEKEEGREHCGIHGAPLITILHLLTICHC